MTERAENLALLMTLEMGKPLADSRAEVTYAAEFLRWFSEEAVRVAGRWSMAPDGASRLVTMKQPVGPALMITPWNFPLAMGTRKIGPAVAAGCTMVVKPAAQTPLSMYALAQLLQEAGLPDGVLSVVSTSRSGDTMAPLIADPRLRKLTFTGSTGVGRTLVEQSAAQLLRVSMELGGNAPFLVMADADLDAAVDGAMVAKMRNMGEACTAANRFLVHDSLAGDFALRLAERMGNLHVGRGTDPGVDVGPLIDAASRDKVQALVAQAEAGGASVLTGGGPAGSKGWFYQPTVLSDVQPDAACLREEIFGPVAPVTRFATIEEAIGLANERVRPGRLRLYPRSVLRAAAVRGAGYRHGRHQSRRRVQPCGALRRGQAVRVRTRGWRGRHRGIPRDQVRRHRRGVGSPEVVTRGSADLRHVRSDGGRGLPQRSDERAHRVSCDRARDGDRCDEGPGAVAGRRHDGAQPGASSWSL
jgi:acyl-CoA reductase-like NAD-dependent aldehyde dehydrogenase